MMQQEIFELRVENHNLKTEVHCMRDKMTSQHDAVESKIARLEGLIEASGKLH